MHLSSFPSALLLFCLLSSSLEKANHFVSAALPSSLPLVLKNSLAVFSIIYNCIQVSGFCSIQRFKSPPRYYMVNQSDILTRQHQLTPMSILQNFHWKIFLLSSVFSDVWESMKLVNLRKRNVLGLHYGIMREFKIQNTLVQIWPGIIKIFPIFITVLLYSKFQIWG